jgi:DNA-binding CsgD family transcriptional regulator
MQTDDSETIARLSALTPAEQAVLDQALTGVTAREIAERLSLSEATVRSHLSSIYVKLGVSGRVALLAHFRGFEAVASHVATSAPPRPMGVSVAGWSWGILAVLEGAYAVYLLTDALADGASQTTWLLAIGFGILAAFGTWLSRAILERPTRKLLAVSCGAAVGLVAFGIRGLFLGSWQLFLVLAWVAFAIGWISFRARSSLQP